MQRAEKKRSSPDFVRLSAQAAESNKKKIGKTLFRCVIVRYDSQ